MSEGKDNQSEIARIKQQIQAEYDAAQQGLTGFAETSKHEFITARMENMGRLQEQLSDLVGNEESAQFLAETMNAEMTMLEAIRWCQECHATVIFHESGEVTLQMNVGHVRLIMEKTLIKVVQKAIELEKYCQEGRSGDE